MIYPDRGYVGCFTMKDKDSGKRQLEEYVRQLKNAGHRRIIAPINGDTWHTYRLVNWSSGEPPFMFEPQNPLWYNEVFAETGFQPLKKYISEKFDLNYIEPLPKVDIPLRFRNFCEDDLKLMYEISLQGFNENFLYSDITFEEFKKLYQPVLPMIDNELVSIIEADNVPAGFIFSIADGDTLIMKTIAVIPLFRKKGIGARMVNHVLLKGKQKGLKTAIAALIADSNNSHKIVSKYGSSKIREYTLYCLET